MDDRAVEVRCVAGRADLSIGAAVCGDDFTETLCSPLELFVQSQPLPEAERPAIASLKTAAFPIRTFEFHFPEAPAGRELPPPPLASSERLTHPTPTRSGPGKAATRIKPPGDVIKLEDRLYYVLQPPLESLIQSDALHFPFEPFPYQYQGVAFLYPRYAAVLADEMGLGKTMQSITAIRMLLRSGELR